MISSVVMRDEKFLYKLLFSSAAYLVLLSFGLNNSIYTDAKEIALNITNTHTGSATTQAEPFFVDKSKEIDNWRLILAKNIALRNKELSIEELNHAVQLTIDRIIFLRIAEDRGIEKYEQLKNLLDLSDNDKDSYPVYEGFIENWAEIQGENASNDIIKNFYGR